MISRTYRWLRPPIHRGQGAGEADLALMTRGNRLLYLAPPFTDFEPIVRIESLRPAQLPVGSLLVLAPATDDLALKALQSSVLRLRRVLPGCPVVLRIREGATAEMVILAATAARVGIRAAIIEGQAPRPTLARQILAPADLGAAIIEWMGIREPLLPYARLAIAEIFRLAPDYHWASCEVPAMTETAETRRSWSGP